jgi:AbrB family looped-hinge helix DNA binding protein
MSHMSLPAGLVTTSLHVGAKGRVVLPAALRRAAHIQEGAELVARRVGDGQLLLETKDAVRARVWSAAPQPVGPDVTADVRAMRDEDVTLEARNADRRESGSGSAADSDAAGAALLARLGL